MNTALSFCCITISNKKKNSGKKEIKSLEALIPLPLLSFYLLLYTLRCSKVFEWQGETI